jgi:glycosyltransferase involved in cell wall biosynthesis
MTGDVVVDGRFLVVRPTGLHRVAANFVRAAKGAGVRLEVWAPGRKPHPLVDRGIPLPGGRAGGRLWEQALLPAAARGRLIWSLTNTAPVLAPGVVVIHDLAVRAGPEWFARSMLAYGQVVLSGARRARRVITVSNAVRDELVAAGVAPGRVSVVSPAVDEQFAPASDERIRQVRDRLGLRREYAVMVGWADPRKDAATAVAAHQRVVGEHQHDLVLVGAGHPTFAPVTLPSLPSLRRIGHLGDGDLVPLLSGASVLLYPSRYEGFGLPPLEALACGTPAVASDIPALRESTAGLVPLLKPGDVDEWAAALLAGLLGQLSCPSPPERRWEAVGRQLADVLAAGSAGSRRRG